MSDPPRPGAPSGVADEPTAADEAERAADRARFNARVAGVFGTRLVIFGCAIAASFLLARLLGPSGRGTYALVLLLPTMLFALGQLGLPSAVTFYAGRGRSLRSLRWAALVLAGAVSGVLVAVAWLLLPVFEATIARGAPDDLLRLSLAVLPIMFVASLSGSILYGRRTIRDYNLIQAAQAVASLVAAIAVVGVLGYGVAGAVGAYIGVTGLAALAVVREVSRVVHRARENGARPARLWELVAYGLRLYPASLTSFFSYRADVFLLAWLTLGDPLATTAAIGLYGVAVTLAELLFYLPDSISTVFYPTVAAAERAEADRLVPSVTRFTVLLTGLGAIALVPSAYLAIRLLLPAYEGSFAPFLILLPGIVSLSVSKVLAGYVSGLGRPLPVTVASVAALALNLGLNLALIPRFGISGAAAASLVSYTAHAAMMAVFAGRLASVAVPGLVLPGRTELERIGSGISLGWTFVRGAIRKRPQA